MGEWRFIVLRRYHNPPIVGTNYQTHHSLSMFVTRFLSLSPEWNYDYNDQLVKFQKQDSNIFFYFI